MVRTFFSQTGHLLLLPTWEGWDPEGLYIDFHLLRLPGSWHPILVEHDHGVHEAGAQGCP